MGILVQSNKLLTYYASQKAAKPSRQAIVLIPGGGVLPEDYFNHADTYLNNAGDLLADKGYDV
jgi:hypothetical protein